MKKIITLSVLLALVIGALAQENHYVVKHRSFYVTPQAFSFNSKPTIYFNDHWYEDEGKVYIMDEGFNEVKSFTYKVPESKSYITLEYRAETSRVDVYDREINPITKEGGTNSWTVEEVKTLLGQDMVVDTREDGTYFFRVYDYEEIGGVKYSRNYYFLNTSGELYAIRAYYNVYRSYTGEWSTNQEEYTYSGDVYKIYLLDHRTTYADGSSFVLSQTLFNEDEAYEYVVPWYETSTEASFDEIDRDGDGDIDYRQTVYSSTVVGFIVMSETGQELQKIRYESGFDGNGSEKGISLLLIGDKCYFMLSGRAKDGDDEVYATLVYEIDRQTSQIQQVARHLGAKVSPTVANRSEMITVEVSEPGAREVQVVNAAGQTVFRVPVKPGQRQVTVPASELSRGVNVVNVVGGQSGTTCKVIVK